jgi:hypothetical protein
MQSQRPTAADDKARTPQRTARKGSWISGRWMLLLLALVCAAPVIASYLMYYVFKPAGGTSSYGALIDPQRPIPAQLVVIDEKGQSLPFKSLEGKWLMITVNGSDCDEQCATRLYFMRQVRALQSGERDRVVNVWLRTDDKPVSDVIPAAGYAHARRGRQVDRGVAARRRRHETHGSHFSRRSEWQSDDALSEEPRSEEDQRGSGEASEVVAHRLKRGLKVREHVFTATGSDRHLHRAAAAFVCLGQGR